MPFLGGKLKCIARDLKSEKCHFLPPPTKKKTKNIFKEEHSLLELLKDALIWGPQHIVDLGNLVQLVGSRKEWIQAETPTYTIVKLFTIKFNKFCLTNPQTFVIQVPKNETIKALRVQTSTNTATNTHLSRSICEHIFQLSTRLW